MATNEYPDMDAWSERAKISICSEGGTEKAFEALTETVDIDTGDKDIDVIATLKGGRVVKYNPQDVVQITLEAYPLEAGTSGSAGSGFFDLMNPSATVSQPMIVPVDHSRNRYRLTILWTNDPDNTGATAVVTKATPPAATVLGLRAVACGYFISVKPAFTDGLLKFTIVLKAPPFRKDATANFKLESTDGTVNLAVMPAFTATTNF